MTKSRHSTGWMTGAALLTGLVSALAQPVPVAAPALDLGTYRAQAMDLINAERAKIGVAGLGRSEVAEGLAQEWAVRLGEERRLNHRSNLLEYLKANGWSGMTENLHGGPSYFSPEELVKSWMNSSVHRTNLMRPDSNQAGIGLARGSTGFYCAVFNGVSIQPATYREVPSIPVPRVEVPMSPANPVPQR